MLKSNNRYLWSPSGNKTADTLMIRVKLSKSSWYDGDEVACIQLVVIVKAGLDESLESEITASSHQHFCFSAGWKCTNMSFPVFYIYGLSFFLSPQIR